MDEGTGKRNSCNVPDTVSEERTQRSIALQGRSVAQCATVLVTARGDGGAQIPLGAVCQSLGRLAMCMMNWLRAAAAEADTGFTWQRHDWMDDVALRWWARNVFRPAKNKVVPARRWYVRLMDSDIEIKRCGDDRVLVWYLEPNATGKLQPVDYRIGKTPRAKSTACESSCMSEGIGSFGPARASLSSCSDNSS